MTNEEVILLKKSDFMHPKGVKALDGAQVPFWFWNDTLEDGELKRQAALMYDAGIKGCAPHARTGFRGGYLDDAWMAHFETVLEEQKKRGGTLWIYDEFNWPSGTGGGEITKNEEFREKYLMFHRVDVPAGTVFRAQISNLSPSKFNMEDQYKEGGHKVRPNVFCYDAQAMEPLALDPFMVAKTYAGMEVKDFQLQRDRDTAVYIVKILTEPYPGEGELTPDYLNPDMTDAFIQMTHEAYYKRFPRDFGNVIQVAFDDETRFCHAFPWTEQLPEVFLEKKGYDLLERLPDLVIPGEEAGRTRCDYFDIVADLYRENYHGRIHQWCLTHGIDYCPHLLGEETLAGQVRFSGDYMRQLAAVGRPGIDHLGKGIGSLNIKFASSAAECYGKSGLACEVFAACGQPADPALLRHAFGCCIGSRDADLSSCGNLLAPLSGGSELYPWLLPWPSDR